MICPACSHALSSKDAGPVRIDVCEGGCGGIFLDNHELERLGAVDPGSVEGTPDPRTQVDLARKRTCPSCGDVSMMRHFSSVARQVVIDRCPGCNGIWLDVGELAVVLRELPDVEARRRAADARIEARRKIDDEAIHALRNSAAWRAGLWIPFGFWSW